MERKLQQLAPRYGQNWRGQHNAALNYPREDEKAIVHFINAWLEYAVAHERMFDSHIGDDGFLGPYWAKIGAGLRGLLNGSLGRLDGGTLDKAIAEALTEVGFDPDNL